MEAIVIGAMEDAAKRAVDMVEVQKAADKVVFEKRRALEDEIKGLDVKMVELDQVLMEMYEDYREEKISRRNIWTGRWNWRKRYWDSRRR